MIRVVVGEPLYATEPLEGRSDRRAYLLKDRVQDHGELGLGDSEHVSRRVKAALMYLADQDG